MIVLNTPTTPPAPSGGQGIRERLARLVRGTDILILSDEVYEHVVFDGALHQSVIRYPELVERSVAVFSFGKTFHVTGWRVGYCVAPRPLMEEIRKVHQFAMFAADTPCSTASPTCCSNRPTIRGWQPSTSASATCSPRPWPVRA